MFLQMLGGQVLATRMDAGKRPSIGTNVNASEQCNKRRCSRCQHDGCQLLRFGGMHVRRRSEVVRHRGAAAVVGRVARERLAAGSAPRLLHT
jgi:hypothetical protein